MDSLKVMILGVQKYQFNDSNTNREVKGTTVHYVQLTETKEDEKRGYFPAKASLPFEYYEVLKDEQFPCNAEASISFDLANKRNPIKVNGFQVLEPISL